MRALWLAVLALAACSHQGSVVVVDVNGVPSGAAIVQGTATIGAQQRGFGIPVAEKSSYAIEIDLPDGLTGTIAVHVDVLAADRGLLAAGDGSIAIAPGARADLSIDLGADRDLSTAPPVDMTTIDLATCTSSSMCPAAMPICTTGVGCGPCDADMPGYSDDCVGHSAKTPLCAAGACVACAADTDCPAGICATDGSCVPASLIAFVDNFNCSSGTKDGSSPANAYCQISDALTATPAKTYIHAAGGFYTAITVDHTVTIVGAPMSGSGSYTVITAAPAVTFAATSIATLTLDSISVVGQARCIGNSAQSLVVKDSQVVMASGWGIDAADCNLDVSHTHFANNSSGGVFLGTGNIRIVGSDFNTNPKAGSDATTGWGIWENTAGTVLIDRNNFYNNGSGAISMNAANYTITNNLILQEGVVGVSLTSAGVFRFNTVLQSPQGISCGPSVPVQDSIVYGNPTGGQNNLSGACVPTNVVVGTTNPSGQGLITLDPDLDGNYRLNDSAANGMCCVDKASPSTPPDHDYFGGKRPLGTAPDIGMHELK